MRKGKKSINKIIILNILSTFLIQGIAFVTAPIFSRWMGTDNYGTYSIYHTWVSIVTVIFGLQVNSTIGVAQREFSKNEQVNYQSSIYFLAFVSYSVCSVIIFILKGYIGSVLELDVNMIILILLQGYCTMTVSFMNSKYTMEYKAEYNMALSVCSSIGGSLLSILLFYIIPVNKNYFARIIGCLLTDFIITIVLGISLFYKGKTLYRNEYWHFCLPIAIPMIFHALSGIILNQSDRIIMQKLLDTSVVGIYSLSFAFSSVVSSIYLALNNSFSPFYFEYLKKNDYSMLRYRCKNYIEIYSVIIVGFMLLSPEVFNIFASEDFLIGRRYIPLFCLGTYFIFLYSFSVNYEMYMKHSNMVAIATSIAAVLNIIFNIILIKFLGVIGVVLATIISDMLQFVIHYLFASRISYMDSHPVPFFTQIPYLITVIIVGLICYIIDDHLLIIRWWLGGSLGLYESIQIFKRKSIF